MAVMVTNKNMDFESLFTYNYRPLCLYALHYLGDVEESEDIVQECFATLWEKLQQGTEVSNRRAYLYMTVRNRCLDQTPLKAVLKTLSEYYKVSFVCTDLSKQLSGEFEVEDLDLILSLIESALDVNIVKM